MGYKNTLRLLTKDQVTQVYDEPYDVKCFYLENPLYDEKESKQQQQGTTVGVQYHMTPEERQLYDTVMERIRVMGKDPNNHLIVQYETLVAKALRDDGGHAPVMSSVLAQGSDAINTRRAVPPPSSPTTNNGNGNGETTTTTTSAPTTPVVEEKSSEEIRKMEMSRQRRNKRVRHHSVAQCSKGWRHQLSVRNAQAPFIVNERVPSVSPHLLMTQNYPWMSQMVIGQYLKPQQSQ